MFRGKFLSGLQSLYRSGRLEFHGLMDPWAAPERFAFWLKKSARPKWVVFAKRPFAGPDQVLSYLSRYTHHVAIGNRRLVMADSKTVTFSYKADSERKVSKTMTLELTEFVRRFALHILPEKFVKIRHYGWLGNRNRTEKLEKARRLLGLEKPDPATSLPEGKAEVDRTGVMRCPYCDKPGLRLLRVVLPTKTTEPRPPPDSS